MKTIARHTHPYRRFQHLDEVELNRGRRRGTGAHPTHADSHHLSRPGPHMTGRMNAEGKRQVSALAGPHVHAHEGPSETHHRVTDVFERPRIEQRLARHATRAPVFGNLAFGREAEVLVEFLVRKCPKHLFVEYGYLAPFFRVFELAGVNVLEPCLPKSRLSGFLDGDDLALALKRLDLLTGSRDR